MEKDVKTLDIRLESLFVYLESKGIICFPNKNTYWSSWLESSTSMTKEEQEKNQNHRNQWKTHVNEIHVNMNECIQSISTNEKEIVLETMRNLGLSDDWIDDDDDDDNVYKERHYFDICKIFEKVVEKDEYGETLIWGKYKNPLLIKLESIMKEYKVNGYYLAQAITILRQLLSYEIPYVKKKLKDIEDEIHVYNKREIWMEKDRSEYETLWRDDCILWDLSYKQINDTNDIDQEVIRLCTDKWNSLCQQIENNFSKEILESIQYYQSFNAVLYQNDSNYEFLPILNSIWNNQNKITSIITSTPMRHKLCQDLNELYGFLHQRQEEMKYSNTLFVPTTPTKTIEELQLYESQIQSVLKLLQYGDMPMLSPFVNDVDYRNNIVKTWHAQFNSIQKIKTQINNEQNVKQERIKEQKSKKYLLELYEKRCHDLKSGLEKELTTILDFNNCKLNP